MGFVGILKNADELIESYVSRNELKIVTKRFS